MAYHVDNPCFINTLLNFHLNSFLVLIVRITVTPNINLQISPFSTKADNALVTLLVFPWVTLIAYH